MKQVYRVERAISDANGFSVQLIPAVASQPSTPGVAQSFVPGVNPQAITVPVSEQDFGQFSYGKYFELELRPAEAPQPATAEPTPAPVSN